jgi:hypothetical protein
MLASATVRALISSSAKFYTYLKWSSNTWRAADTTKK